VQYSDAVSHVKRYGGHAMTGPRRRPPHVPRVDPVPPREQASTPAPPPPLVLVAPAPSPAPTVRTMPGAHAVYVRTVLQHIALTPGQRIVLLTLSTWAGLGPINQPVKVIADVCQMNVQATRRSLHQLTELGVIVRPALKVWAFPTHYPDGVDTHNPVVDNRPDSGPVDEEKSAPGSALPDDQKRAGERASENEKRAGERAKARPAARSLYTDRFKRTEAPQAGEHPAIRAERIARQNRGPDEPILDQMPAGGWRTFKAKPDPDDDAGRVVNE
jgi:hypothetical protein